MATAEETTSAAPEAEAADSGGNGTPTWVDPDLDFILALREQAGTTFKRCFQCGTCSSTCELSPDVEPFPRKEMAWAAWGLRDRLLRDPDVWLCHQCNDCSTRCPRGGRPGDVLAAVRREAVRHYSWPRVLGRWLGQPSAIPLLLGIPALLLCAALMLRVPLENALGIVDEQTPKIAYPYSKEFPHWMLNGFFGLVTLAVVLVFVAGVTRFWRALKAATPPGRLHPPAKGMGASILAALKRVVGHGNLARCTSSKPRYLSHALVFFGFLALTLVTLWVITIRMNPLVQGTFLYPFGFWHPFKMLANVGGAALAAGCLLMLWDRLYGEEAGGSTYFDWSLIATLLLVVVSGFVTEILHYVRLEPHRHIAYFVHLVFVLALLLFLPYSKLAHVVYRTVAMVFAERTGRQPPPPAADDGGQKTSPGGAR